MKTSQLPHQECPFHHAWYPDPAIKHHTDVPAINENFHDLHIFSPFPSVALWPNSDPMADFALFHGREYAIWMSYLQVATCSPLTVSHVTGQQQTNGHVMFGIWQVTKSTNLQMQINVCSRHKMCAERDTHLGVWLKETRWQEEGCSVPR